jgi:hypothetical protein
MLLGGYVFQKEGKTSSKIAISMVHLVLQTSIDLAQNAKIFNTESDDPMTSVSITKRAPTLSDLFCLKSLGIWR